MLFLLWERKLNDDITREFHQLNNQLGVILANAELLEQRLTEAAHKARAGQVVAGTLEAIAITRKIRLMTSGQ
jgi:hypothetical protein